MGRTSAWMGRTLALAMAVASIGTWIFPEIAAHGQTPAPAAKADKTDPATAPAEDAEPSTAPTSPPSTVSKERRTDCEHYIDVFAGREKDSATLKKPEARKFAPHAVELITCSAVRGDSDAPCNLLDKETAEGCRATRAVFHELRAYPNGRSYMFDDRKYKECKENGGMPPVVCDALRKALRAGDAALCVMEADFAAICREAVKAGNLQEVDAANCGTVGPTIRKMLEGQCRALVNLDPAACYVEGPHADGMAEQCRKDIEGRKPYGQGLKELAKSGSLPEREFAKAALEDRDACEGLTKSAMDACLEAGAAPPTGRSGGGTDTTGPAAQKTPPPATEGATPPQG